MKLKFYIPFLFLYVNFFSQNKADIKEQCRVQYDSVFIKYFADKFFKKNIRYDKSRSFIDVYLTDNIDDIENGEEFKTVYINLRNYEDIKKYQKQYPKFYYSDHYTYLFLYKNRPFYQRVMTCELVNKKEYSDYENAIILSYYNKIKNKEYLTPKKISRIAKSKGFKNICYQSLISLSFRNNGKVVWLLQDCSDAKQIKNLELDPATGNVIDYYEEDYGDIGRATYWNLINGR